MSIVRTIEEYEAALEEAFRWEEEILIEDYIEGREFSVGVLEGKALPIIEIAPVEGFYDYKNKYKSRQRGRDLSGTVVRSCYKTDAAVCRRGYKSIGTGRVFQNGFPVRQQMKKCIV